MKARFLGLLPLLLSVLAVTPGAQASTPREFFETTVVEDAPGDYASNGALDIVAVHVGEKYDFDVDNQSGADVVNFRLELRNRNEIQSFAGQVPLEFVVGFTLGGNKVTKNVTMTQSCGVGTQGLVCAAPTVPAPHFTTQDGGVILSLDAEAEGLLPGLQVTEIFAASATAQAGNKVYQDLAPKNNSNTPEGSSLAPAEYGDPYTLLGKYPFLTMRPLSPLEWYATPGGEAKYVVEFTTAQGLSGIDNVHVLFQVPAGWSVESSVDPPVLTVNSGGLVFEYEFTVKAPAIVTVGTTGVIVMDAVLVKHGGRAVAVTTTTVSENKIDVPAYGFELLSGTSYTADDDSNVQVGITHNGAPLLPSGVSFDFIQDGEVVATKAARQFEPGKYEAVYAFPDSGTWTVDAYISELSPSPHQGFEVSVKGKDKGFLPGFDAVLLLAALAVAFASATRRM